MTFGEFKQLDYDKDLPMEYALVQSLFEGKINIIEVNNAYSIALEKERRIKDLRFEEACITLTQLLSGNYKGKSLTEAQQRAIHTLNMSRTLPPNIYNEKYSYTEETKKKWDEFCKTIYGEELWKI